MIWLSTVLCQDGLSTVLCVLRGGCRLSIAVPRAVRSAIDVFSTYDFLRLFSTKSWSVSHNSLTLARPDAKREAPGSLLTIIRRHG